MLLVLYVEIETTARTRNPPVRAQEPSLSLVSFSIVALCLSSYLLLRLLRRRLLFCV